jgi:ethanolaminephosphotransferase
LNTSLSILTWASATGLGQSWWTVGSLWASLANFYLSTWQEYHTGHLYLGYFSGPVEGLLMLCVIHFFSGYFGPAIWTTRLNEILTGLSPHSVLGYFQLNHLLVVLGALVLLFNILSG